ncbi:MAG: NAD(P)-binding protein [Gammaproteobacteria bacterium]|nr:MAG: NAD(P)-binding protein [Gammaproteobacteria bacterium]
MMPRDSRYDILFESVDIGPVRAKNRFFQVPHCSGMGYRHPQTEARMRGVKAEGGWAVISTQECTIHWSGDYEPGPDARLWDDRDIPALALMAEAVHEHGALAAIELTHNGPMANNLYSRVPPLAPSHLPVDDVDPVQARAMSKTDIANLRTWHRNAALRAKRAGFDIVYVYAGHDLSLPMQFLSRRWNHRSDEYGGCLENRARLFRELIEDTRDAVGDSCGVAVRFAVDELLGPDGITAGGEGREVVEMLAELPDLWDVNVSDWSNDSSTSRFEREAAQEKYTAFVKQITSKPVVGVGRFTSPDTMVSQINRGVLDFIGAARPSIADPFLPRKIEEGRPEDIRECIGCNICVSGERRSVPMRCTQNPTMGEEWRRGWHPERIAAKGSDDRVLVVGAGPAGLECARALGARGYAVTLAEASDQLGGRVTAESRLPGLAEWARVRDYRVSQLNQMPDVEIYRASRLSAEHVLEFGFPRVVIATGARWRRDGIGRRNRKPIPGCDGGNVYTPEDVMGEVSIPGPVIVFDDDHAYLGGVLAEKLRAGGRDVTLVTPAAQASVWTWATLEQFRIQSQLMNAGIDVATCKNVVAVEEGSVELTCVYTDVRSKLDAASVVMVTARLPEDSLFQALQGDANKLADAGIRHLECIGDSLAPATIAAAVYAGHVYARECDQPESQDIPFRREFIAIGD